MTDSTTTAEEFDPLDNPQIAAFYNGLKQRQGLVAAERYLLTAKPKPTDGMTVTTPPVVTSSKRTKELKAAPTLTEPLPASRALAGSDAVLHVSTTESESTTSLPVVVTEEAPILNMTHNERAEEASVEVATSNPVSTTETLEPTVSTDTSDVADATESPTTVVSSTSKRKRKPVRSTAEVKQAFEDALEMYFKAGKPFLRTHVTRAAGLGASFYYTYPLLRTKVDEAIAAISKPNKAKTQSQATTMSAPVSQAKSTTVTLEPSSTAAVAAVVPQAAVTPTEVGNSPVVDEKEAVTAPGALTHTQETALTSTQRPVTGLEWTEIEALALYYRSEQAQLQQQISSLLADLDTAVENAKAYERVLQLHTPQTERTSHVQ